MHLIDINVSIFIIPFEDAVNLVLLKGYLLESWWKDTDPFDSTWPSGVHDPGVPGMWCWLSPIPLGSTIEWWFWVPPGECGDSESPAKEIKAVNKDGRKSVQAQHNAKMFLLLGLALSSRTFKRHKLAAINMAAPGVTNIQVAHAVCRIVFWELCSIYSLNANNKGTRKVLLLSPFYRKENCVTEKLSNIIH